jgi:glycosyltransferase involved in cell wall biosynthesis
MEKISVIVPVYNSEKYIAKCIDSVLSQTYTDYRLYLIDDGSEDTGGDICDGYSHTYSDRIEVYHQRNAGVGAARNAGIRMARGKYVYFIDADDSIEPETLDTLINAAESTRAQICIGGIRRTYQNGEKEIIVENVPSRTILDPSTNKELFFSFPGIPNKLIEKRFLTDNRLEFSGAAIGEDLELFVKLLSAADRVVYIDTPLYNYTCNSGSAMNASFFGKYEDLLNAFEGIISYFQAKGYYDRYFSEIEFLATKHVFLDASVRILKGTGDKSALLSIYRWMKNKYPRCLGNKYTRRFSARERLILRLLSYRKYKVVSLIFRVKNSVAG